MNPVPSAASSGGSNEQFELAGWGARLAAYTLDQIFRLLLAVAIAIAGFVLIADDPFSLPSYWTEADFPAPGTDAGEYNLLWLLLTIGITYLVLAIFYAPLFMARWRGATPGKKMIGIRVINESGTDLSLGQAFLREPVVKGLLINGIGGTFVLVALVSYLWPLWDRECRAGHDFIVKSRVVRAAR